jgi:hypothetical protein
MMNGDHTTILHHIRKFKDFYDTNDIYYMGYYKSLMEHLARNGYSVVTMEKFIKEINKNKKIR